MKAVGLDIGTTTICAVVVETGTGTILQTRTVPNDTAIKSPYPFERLQDPARILEKAFRILEELITPSDSIDCVGVTGQMHGIVYLDDNGDAVSPLYYWQDESGNEPYSDSMSFAEFLSKKTGFKMASGFGGTTYFYHARNGQVPSGAVKFCTIHDYVAMKLCGRKEPLVHSSDAASFGLFDLNALAFDAAAIDKAELDFRLFPDTTAGFETAGLYKERIPVSVAIGDNQASFLGSVRDMDSSVLVNVGTGSQISYLTGDTAAPAGTEIRPCFADKYLCVGSSLCGGRAFAALEGFLRETAVLITGEPCNSAYPAIDRYLAQGSRPENPLKVSTLFCGTRDNPALRGSVENLGTDNFTPGHFIWGVLEGMAGELRAMYRPADGQKHTTLVGSGNALRKNPALQALFAECFGMELRIPANSEEAAFGAALFGLAAVGFEKSIDAAQSIIQYRQVTT